MYHYFMDLGDKKWIRILNNIESQGKKVILLQTF